MQSTQWSTHHPRHIADLRLPGGEGARGHEQQSCVIRSYHVSCTQRGWDTRGSKMGMTSLETGEGDLVSTIFSQSDVQAAVTTCLMNNSHLFLTDLCAWCPCFRLEVHVPDLSWHLVVSFHAEKGKKKASSFFIPKTLISLMGVGGCLPLKYI